MVVNLSESEWCCKATPEVPCRTQGFSQPQVLWAERQKLNACALVPLYCIQGSYEFIIARLAAPKMAVWRYRVGHNVQSRETIFFARGLVRVLVRQRFQKRHCPSRKAIRRLSDPECLQTRAESTVSAVRGPHMQCPEAWQEALPPVQKRR